MLTLLRRWLPFAMVCTLACALPYALSQQVLRMGADDLPLRIANDASSLLEKGTGAASVVGAYSVDTARSLSPFLIVFGESGAAIASSGTIDQQTFLPPEGVLEASRATGESRLTWQPRADIRLATVVRHFGGEHPGFVLAAQSLQETERTSTMLLHFTLIAYAVSLLVTLLAVAVWPKKG
jgi:hypothetical protein